MDNLLNAGSGLLICLFLCLLAKLWFDERKSHNKELGQLNGVIQDLSERLRKYEEVMDYRLLQSLDGEENPEVAPSYYDPKTAGDAHGFDRKEW